ncbi:hypothetical protein ACFQZE_10885 [Paenibacillus sp. GCM10027627]|uniref:hypothetical protein n=1 Tax=unclassified Paenibacillus TaxID=185978 RepID=UPI00363A36EC
MRIETEMLEEETMDQATENHEEEIVEEGQVDEIQQSMSALVQELNALQELTSRMKTVYASAAAKNDLTFINIIEERYEDVLAMLQRLASRAEDELNRMVDEEEVDEGGLENGREEPSLGSGFAQRAVS